MIGIFDSGSGGLTFLNEAQKIMNEYDFVYLGDYPHCPYGNKNSDEIFELTKSWVLKLRDAWAKIVILACNTAVANSIKKLQADEKNIGIKVLGVTIAGAEKVVEEKMKKILVVATASTVNQKLYKNRVNILDENVEVIEKSLPELAIMVENFLSQKITETEIDNYLKKELEYIDADIDGIVLGCTHYSHIIDIFAKIFPNKKIIDPSFEWAKKLKIYLQKHQEIDKNLTKNSKIIDISIK